MLDFSYIGAKSQSNTASKVSPSQIRGAIDPAATVVLSHSTSPMLAQAADLGTVSPDKPMEHILLVLNASEDKVAAAEQYLIDQQNPASANYHRWLTATEFGDKFGPSVSDRQAIASWLTDQGFVVNSIAASGGWIDFSGSVSTVQKAFHTSIHSYSLNGQSHIANATDISIPAALSSVVKGVVRLNNFLKKTPITSQRIISQKAGQKAFVTGVKANASQIATPMAVQANGLQTLTPGDLQIIYDTATLNKGGTDGTGTSIAIIGRSNVELADMEAFRTIFQLPAKDPQIILVGPDPGLVANDETESALDIEYAGALAPNATIKFVTAQSTDTADGVDLAATYAVDNLVAPIISESYGECEPQLGTAGNAFYNKLWQQAAAEGISVLISAGDTGSAGCDATAYVTASGGIQVNGIGSTPYNTSVGGLMFDGTAIGPPYWSLTNTPNLTSALGYAPEKVWNESCDPTKPIVLYGNCSAYVSTPRSAYDLNYAGSGGPSSCTASTSTTTNGTTTYSCTAFYPKPSWQSGTGVPADGARDNPDVAFAAAGGSIPYIICQGGSCQYAPNSSGGYDIYQATAIGGTSAASPLFAGLVGLLTQKYGAQGLLNYKLYQLANTQPAGSCSSLSQTDPTTRGTCIFHDVTTGSNAVPCTGGSLNCSSTSSSTTGLENGYSAGVGYDMASGLGSVDGANLISNWGSISLAGSTTTATATPTSTNAWNEDHCHRNRCRSVGERNPLRAGFD